VPAVEPIAINYFFNLFHDKSFTAGLAILFYWVPRALIVPFKVNA
jgi:hypothetical protein